MTDAAAAIRPLEPHDAEAAASLIAAEWPHRRDEAEALRRGELDPDVRRWTAADPAGRVAGYAALWRVRGDRFRVDLVVASERRRQGIGSLMLETAVAAAREDGAATVQARALDTAEDSLRFLERRGFAETMRMVGMVLDVRTIDPARLRAYEDAARANGFALTTLADELRRDPERLRAIWQVYAAAQDGWADPDPRPEPEAPLDYDAFLRRLDELPLVPHAFVIARHGERVVGFAGSIGTVVHPGFRGRGLATALKARVAHDASSRGIASIETATGSAAMIRANENVGYRRAWTEVRLVRRISG